MYSTSKLYNLGMDSTFRNVTKAKIIFGLVNEEAIKTVTITDNDHIFFSDSNNLAKGIDVTNTYHTLERNRFVLDGRNILISKNNREYQGFCSNTISGNEVSPSLFNKSPILTFEFDKEVSLSGLTLKFDTITNSYPTRCKLVGLDSKGQKTIELYEKLDASMNATLIINKGFNDCKKIIIEFYNTFPSRRRLRVLSVTLGRTVVIDNTELQSVVLENSIDCISASLPVQNLKFNVIDTTNSYDLDNPNNVQRYLESGQPVEYLLGYEINDKNTEWIPICKLFTTGTVSMTGSTKLATLSFEANSILSKLNMKYPNILLEEKSLYDLAMDLIEYVELPHLLQIDPILREYKTTIPLPNIAIKESLQLIANAGCCIMSLSRNGQVIIKRENSFEYPNFKFKFNNMTSTPKVDKVPILKSLTSSYHKILIEDKELELLNSSFEISSEKSLILEYETSTNHRYETTGSLTIVEEPKFYCNAVELKLSGRGTLLIYGNKINTNSISKLNVINDVGVDVSISNPLIDNSSWLNDYMQFIIDYYTRRTTYSFQDRGYPNIDMLDLISIENNYNNDKIGKVIEYELNYNGSLSGKTKVLSEQRGV